jgi:hypothetical protein
MAGDRAAVGALAPIEPFERIVKHHLRGATNRTLRSLAECRAGLRDSRRTAVRNLLATDIVALRVRYEADYEKLFRWRDPAAAIEIVAWSVK